MIEVSSNDVENISEDVFSLVGMMHREAVLDAKFLVPKSSFENAIENLIAMTEGDKKSEFSKSVAYVADKAYAFKMNVKSEAHFDGLCRALNGLRAMFNLDRLTF